MSDQIIIIEGSPLGGFAFVGPFVSRREAGEYIAYTDPDDLIERWIGFLMPPDDKALNQVQVNISEEAQHGDD